MIKSMTGYGSAKGHSGETEISVELKSVNSRYLDCSVKLPRSYISFEEPLKTAVGKHITRGKVDVFVTLDLSKSGGFAIKVNRPLADAYIRALRELSEAHGLPDSINVLEIMRLPDVVQVEKEEIDSEQLCADICSVLEEALLGFDEMRAKEGLSLCTDILARLVEIEKLTAKAEEISPRSIEEYASKLETRMRELLQATDIDEQRIAMEAAVFADRVAINEETVRLNSHIAQLRKILESSEPVGRKIDFLLQEFNREANTIGSKGNDTEMAKVTVDLKSEIEKIREQAQNVE